MPNLRNLAKFRRSMKKSLLTFRAITSRARDLNFQLLIVLDAPDRPSLGPKDDLGSSQRLEQVPR